MSRHSKRTTLGAARSEVREWLEAAEKRPGSAEDEREKVRRLLELVGVADLDDGTVCVLKGRASVKYRVDYCRTDLGCRVQRPMGHIMILESDSPAVRRPERKTRSDKIPDGEYLFKGRVFSLRKPGKSSGSIDNYGGMG